MAISTLSRAVWDRVIAEGAGEDAWADFHRHYWGLVLTWALRRLGREHAAEEVAVDVFSALYRRITDAGLEPVKPDDRGSFRPFVYAVVTHLCAGYRRSESRRARLGLTLADVDRLEEPTSIGNLCDDLAAQEEFDLLMTRYQAVFAAAFRRLKAAPQFDPRTLAAFLRAHRDGKRHKEVDLEFGQKPGWSSKACARVRERLLSLMVEQDGRGEIARAEYDSVLDGLLWMHGDPST